MGLDIIKLGSIFDFGGKVIDKIFPDKTEAEKAKLAMLKLQQEGAFKELEAELEIVKGQMAINAEEAKSSNTFVSGWRPAVGWVCVVAYAFNYLVLPFVNWLSLWIDKTAPSIVALETGELTTLLFGMLGIGTLRTYEKVKQVAR